MQTKYPFEKIILIISGIILFQNTYCQENYSSGYIIQLNGDTLNGFIDYRNWDRNPDKILFKEKLSDNKLDFVPLDIKGFNVLDEIYESAIIETEVSPDYTSDIQYNKELLIEIDTTFLQTKIQGLKSLYYFKNKIGKEQLYIRQDSSYKLLIYKKYLKNQDGQDIIVESNIYLGQLSNYLQDCPAVQSKLRNTEYNIKSIENLFQFYYKCTNSEIKFQKKTEKLSAEFGVIAGMSLTSLKFKSDAYDYLVNADYNKSLNFSGGLSINIVFPRNQGKWSLYNELLLSTYKVSGRFENYENENIYTITYTTIGLSYLKLNNMIRFKYPIRNLYVYFNAGLSNGFAISEINYRKQETKFYTTERVEEDKAINEIRKYEHGYIGGIGIKYKKYSFELRYESGNGISDYTALGSSTNRLYLLLGYKF